MTSWPLVSTVYLFISAFAASWIGVALFRRWTIRRGFLDIPNVRSSHSTPTPRGGGLIIVLVCLVCYWATAFLFQFEISWGYFLGALLVATVGWLDDIYSLGFTIRLLVHAAAASILISDVGSWSEFFIPLASISIPVGSVLGIFLAVVWVVWLVNAFNFIDGIDGIAALQAIVAGLAWAALGYTFGFHGVFLLAGVIASASAGFLIHNWQPAKIFMGDVGSSFLGFTLAAMPLLARSESKLESPILPLIGVAFVWLVVLDTVFTRAKRVLSGQNVLEAHREHIYQKLTIEGKKHATVALMYGSAAVFLSLAVLFAVVYSGIYDVLVLFSFVLLTFLFTYFGVRKKH